MPRNIYISHGTRSERDLLDDLIIESIKVFGHDMYYIPRKITKLDRVLNEDDLAQFDDAYMCEMYVESIDGFEGDGKLVTKFGLEIRDQLTIVVSVRRWNQLVGRFGYPADQVRPAEGDLIYVPLTKGLYEIKYVEDKKPFLQLGGAPTYKLIVELFEYVNQNINTGVEEIDAIQSYSSTGTSVLITFANLDEERFVVGYTITFEMPDGSTGGCEILDIQKTDDHNVDKVFLGPLTFDDGVFKILQEGTNVTDLIHEAYGQITQVFDLSNANDDTTFVNDDNAQNSQFESEGNAFIDFSEENPFGEIDK